jgi:hypothetical protein
MVAESDAGASPSKLKARVMRLPPRADAGPTGTPFRDLLELVLGFNPLLPSMTDAGAPVTPTLDAGYPDSGATLPVP